MTDEYYFDEEAAQEVLDWIETFIPYPDGDNAGQPITLLPFQKEIISDAFGWKRTRDQRRKHSIVYIEIPKGNAKSTLVTALCLYMLVKGETASEIYCCAGSSKMARKVFHPAKVMVALSADLREALKVYDFSITDKETYGRIEVISADGEMQHGHKPNFIAFDELHVQPNSELWDSMRAGLTKKKEPMMFVMTTAGLTSTFAEQIHNYAIGVKTGVIKAPHWLVKIWAADLDADPFKEETWKACNPGWQFINQEEFRNEAKEAESNPIYLNNFKRLHLNIWTGSQEAFIPVEKWDLCNFGKIDMQRRRTAFMGIDNAVTRDICAAALLFPPDEVNPYFEIKLFGWCPSETIRDRTKNENVNYPQWVKEGWIHSVPGTSVESQALYDVLSPLHAKFDVVSVQYDRKFMNDLIVMLTNDGWTCEPMAQDTTRQHEAIEMLTNLVLNKKEKDGVFVPDPRLNHEGNPIFRWMIGNAVTYMDTGGLKRVDKKGSRDKIDYVAAAIMAFYGYLQSVKEPQEESALTKELFNKR